MKSNMFLLLAALIWGFAFVAQRVGMDHVGPYTFNGIRFALGALSLIPLLLFLPKNESVTAEKSGTKITKPSAVKIGLLAGCILFPAASLQQIGLLYTTAGKAAFVTCLYIVLVPILGIFLKQATTINTWLGTALAAFGLYFLCVKETLTISPGDFLVLIGALFWSCHILLIDRYAGHIDTVKLAFVQFSTCSLFSLLAALFLENITVSGIQGAAVPLLYGGVCSVGIAYTLQIVGQKGSSPSHAAIILSMETVFATLGGYLILDEKLGFTEWIGCALMFAGMLISQLKVFHFKEKLNHSHSSSKA
ncbi:MAG: DMT family transporter [Sporomusaceae bacterium]|nr:DMT family transporter [Sporomusaceae bacterium]